MASTLIQQVPIQSIRVKGNRRDLQDVTVLAESISKRGLLNLITVSSDFQLIAGLHRLTACRQVGWKKIPAHIINVTAAAEV
jgi:ParB family chromosome partitioning protein